MAKTGETRKKKQPLKIDRLPSSVHDAILFLYTQRGKTWDEIEALSAEKYSAEWKTEGGGFVDWDNLPLSVLELFPECRLPHTTLHRWHDLRVAQVSRSVMERSAEARKLAVAFAKSVVTNGDQAVINAARDTFLSVLNEDNSSYGRQKAGKALIVLAEVMQSARANDIKERKVAAEERKLQLLEQREKLAIQKLEAETDRLAKKARSGEPITEEELKSVRMKAFGF